MPAPKNPDKIYTITLLNEATGLNTTVKVRETEYILDAAEQQGIQLPASCRAGACISCTGKIIKGEVDQDHSFLKPKELQAGFVLTCRAYPSSDCTLITHQEEALLDL